MTNKVIPGIPGIIFWPQYLIDCGSFGRCFVIQ